MGVHGWSRWETGGPLRLQWARRAAAEAAGYFPAGIFPGSDAGAAASGRTRAPAAEPGGKKDVFLLLCLVLAKVHNLSCAFENMKRVLLAICHPSAMQRFISDDPAPEAQRKSSRPLQMSSYWTLYPHFS